MKLMRGLTDAEIKDIAEKSGMYDIDYESDPIYYSVKFARSILEAAWIKTQDPLKNGN